VTLSGKISRQEAPVFARILALALRYAAEAEEIAAGARPGEEDRACVLAWDMASHDLGARMGDRVGLAACAILEERARAR
jgi:hypothetical protein